MSEFKLVTCRELPVAKIGHKYYILDTLWMGTKIGGSVMIDGTDWADLTGTRSTEEEQANWSRAIGAHIDGVLGSDFLCGFHTVIDYRGGKLSLSRNVHDFGGVTIQGLDASLRPVLDMTVSGEQKRVLLSTGFGISYFRNFCGSSNDCVLREYSDGASLHAPHVTEVFRAAAFWGPSRINLRIGKCLPSGLDDFLSELNVDGVVGYDFFSRFKVGLNTFSASFAVCESNG